MPAILLSVLVIVLLLWALVAFSRADARTVIRVARISGGIAALAGGAALAVRGQLLLGVPLALVGVGLLGWLDRRARRVSRLRSAFLETELDHASGAMGGR